MTTAANETEMTLVQAVTDALACEMRAAKPFANSFAISFAAGDRANLKYWNHRQFDWACHERHATRSRAAI